MSTWAEIVNDLKRRYAPEMLTPSQSAAYDRLCKLLSLPEWVNLNGPHGAGKTFVAWNVARATGAVYLPSQDDLDALPANQSGLIIDSVPHTEDAIRRLLSRCELLGAQSVLLVTCSPALLPMPSVELAPPTSEDIEQVGRLITRMGYFFKSDRLPESPSFWDVLLASV